MESQKILQSIDRSSLTDTTILIESTIFPEDLKFIHTFFKGDKYLKIKWKFFHFITFFSFLIILLKLNVTKIFKKAKNLINDHSQRLIKINQSHQRHFSFFLRQIFFLIIWDVILFLNFYHEHLSLLALNLYSLVFLVELWFF